MGRLERGRAKREAARRDTRPSLAFWLRLIVVVVLVAVLMVQVVRVLDQSYWRDSEVETGAARMGQTAALVNAQWLRQGRQGPVQLQLPAYDGQGAGRLLEVNVNANGWPVPDTLAAQSAAMTARDCLALWYQLTQMPVANDQVFSASWQAESGECVYSVQGNQRVKYRVANGHMALLND
ncbi:MAG: hypothetical protein M1473_05655 [Firmicutes bacterium]|nr:hypothetical protein [Bacillota bacterium]